MPDFPASDNEEEPSKVPNFSEKSSSEPENTASTGTLNALVNFFTGNNYYTPEKPTLSSPPSSPPERKRRPGETVFPAEYFGDYENTRDKLRLWLTDRSFFSEVPSDYRYIIQHYFDQQSYDYFFETFARAYLAVVLWMVDQFKDVTSTDKYKEFKTAAETYLHNEKRFTTRTIKEWWTYARLLPGKVFTQAKKPSVPCEDCPFIIKNSQSFQDNNADLLEKISKPNNPLFADFWNQDEKPDIPEFSIAGNSLELTPPNSSKSMYLDW